MQTTRAQIKRRTLGTRRSLHGVTRRLVGLRAIAMRASLVGADNGSASAAWYCSAATSRALIYGGPTGALNVARDLLRVYEHVHKMNDGDERYVTRKRPVVCPDPFLGVDIPVR